MSEQEDQALVGARSASSQSRTFLAALGVGALVTALGSSLALLVEHAPGNASGLQELLYWMSPSLGAAAAGGMAARRMGASAGRAAALALLAFLSALAITGVLDYVMLLGFVTSPVIAPPSEEPSWMKMLWRRQIVISCLALLVATLLGVMFGRPDWERRVRPLDRTRS